MMAGVTFKYRFKTAARSFKKCTYLLKEEGLDIERSKELSLTVNYDFAGWFAWNGFKGLHHLHGIVN